VVDDHDAVRTLVVLMLRRAGFTVQSAAHGEEALELYRERHPAIDVVLLDVQMPGLDGPATLAALQEIDPDVKC
jgi:CheY-like chemotaxis protein